MIRNVPVHRSRYAPDKLVTPGALAVSWTPERQDPSGASASLLCPDAVEVRFLHAVGSDRLQITVRGRLTEGEGTEWSIAVPLKRFGLLSLPVGFSCEQAVMGSVYRLPKPRTVRVYADQMLNLPGLNFTVQIVN